MVPERFEKPENIQRCAQRLCELGYLPVPIPLGSKGPTIEGWTDLHLTAEQVPDYFPENGMLVGVLHKNVLALDIDVYDAELSRQIVTEAIRRFPNALERIGEAPKSAIFLRMEEPGFKVRGTRKYERGGLTAQLDVRSVTRQIVAYGKHPATGRPYTWPRGELWATPRESLPEAKLEEITQFRDWADNLIQKWAGVADPKIIDLGLYSPRQTLATDEKMDPPAFIAALRHIPSNLAYDEWLSCLMGIHDFFAGSIEGLNVAKDWSSDYPYYSPHEVEAKWRSFEAGKGVSYRSVLHMAKQNGADLRPKAPEPYAHEKRETETLKPAETASDAVEASEATDRDLSPADIFGVFPPPELPRGLLPKVIEDFAIIQGEQMGADPGGLAAAALCVCCAAIPDDVKVRVKRYEDWHESARIWVALVGDPSTKKSPVLSAAERPLRAIDANLYKDYIRKKADYDALKKDEKAEVERPRQTRKRLEDTTIEAAQEVMADSPDGLLVVQDELSGWFGGMDRYSNGKGRDRSFWLQAFNGGVYAYNRVGRGAGMVNNLSACVLGGIQPEPIRGIVADAHDDGLIQRLFPIILKPARLGSEDAPPTDAVRAYGEAVAALTRVEVMRPVGVIDVGDRARLIFSDGAQRIRRELEEKHLALMAVECVSRKLAAHIGKYDGLFARLCVAFHAIENAHAGMIPTMVGEDTARRVAEFLHRFFLRHALAFYNGTLSLSDDHDRLTSLAGYILAHKLEVVSARDVARGDGTMRKLTRGDVVRLFEQLEALGWVEPQVGSTRVNAAPAWVVNPEVHRLFAERGAQEAAKRADVAKKLADLRADRRKGF